MTERSAEWKAAAAEQVARLFEVVSEAGIFDLQSFSLALVAATDAGSVTATCTDNDIRELLDG